MSAADSDIAVIGVSFELPNCSTWPELERLLSRGADCVTAYPQSRVDAMGLARDERDAEGCWQENIGAFDHRYFGLSRAEAELVDPRQRRMLSLAVDTIGRAGYAPGELRGRNVAVLVAGYCGIQPSLLHLLPDQDQNTGRAFAGSLPAYSAGRIAYHLDLRGSAFVVDTACSSFLVALHEARWKLARGESELALVGGYAAMLGDIPARPVAGEGMGVSSPTNRCLSFDADADGTVIGEGGGFVLLKRLDAALRDGDLVHAVIRGSALNQDAARSNGLTAPSPTAQAEVISASLRDAGIDPATVGYVEAHGTGTRVGDPIEMRALAETYGVVPAIGGSRPVSSAKANFGHLDAMAGFAGLVRVLAQFRAGRVFPTANFRTLNPLIDLAGVPLHVAVESEPWPASQEPRRAGISAFGLSGTNAHVIVEQAPRPTCPVPAGSRNRLVVLSAPTPAALRQVTEQIRDVVTARDSDLDAVADILAVGREHFGHRSAWIARDSADLVTQIDETLAAGAEHTLPATSVVLAMGDFAVTEDEVALLAAVDPSAAEVVRRAEAHTPRQRWSATQRSLVQLVAQYTVLIRYGVRFDLVLAHGVGALARRVGEGAVDLESALDSACEAPAPPERERLDQALVPLGGDLTLVDLAPRGALSQLLSQALSHATVVTPGTMPAEAVRTLYLQGRAIDWSTGIGPAARRLELPLAHREEEPCWPAMRPRTPVAEIPLAETTAEDGGHTVAEVVLHITRDLLKEPMTLTDDFFSCGGDSLNGALLIARLNKRFGTELEVLDLYELPDLGALVAEIEGAPDTAMTPAPATAPQPASDGEPLSGQQTAIWTALVLDPESDAYSVPAAMLVHGELDSGRLETGLRALVARHAMLRCTLQDVDGEPRQFVSAPVADEPLLHHLEMDFGDRTAAAGREELLLRLRELIAEPFRPYIEPSRRFHLVRARFGDCVQQVLVLNFHHLFFDGWSWGLVMDELSAVEPLPELSRGYPDHVRDQAALLDGERGEKLDQFWAHYLSGAVPGVLPTDRSALGPVTAGADLSLPVADRHAARLREICTAERTSLNMLFTAAWAVLLWRIGGDTDLCVAMPVANRSPDDERVLGCYVNTVLVRVRLDADQTFGELLAQVRDVSLQAISHGDCPIDRILRTGRHPSGQPLAATMLGFQTVDEPRRLGADGPLLQPLDVRQEGAQFPLELTVLNGARDISLVLKYATELFHGDTAATWLDRFQALLGWIAEQGAGIELTSLVREEQPEREAETSPAVADLPDFDF
ncbi:condensation domain-containing protein [Streptomyces hokutonensis]|uniref:condensation domain-containing protein n=1 Tax=Streptomyces hokutonensis TaxID=1306990 RepID=UPI0038121438